MNNHVFSSNILTFMNIILFNINLNTGGLYNFIKDYIDVNLISLFAFSTNNRHYIFVVLFQEFKHEWIFKISYSIYSP